MKRRHELSFGAEVLAAGVRFRLWAPRAKRVELLIGNGTGPRVMQPVGDGMTELECTDAGHGTRYRFRIDGDLAVPDPASRSNPDDVHGASMVIDPLQFDWPDRDWRGRPWHEAVIYELHVGTFSPEGTFAGAAARLDHLVELGVTALELMPVAEFAGRRGWGYDGVLMFAPESSYGTPDDLKRLVAAAHARGLMVFLDAVYNHFGPEGNYLGRYAPQFFTQAETPWGRAIDYSQPRVREFAIENALYWLNEYHFDGLRLDAVHAIHDDSPRHLLFELAERVRAGPGTHRHVHLVLENDDNAPRYLTAYNAQWNDDVHHVLHLLATGERDGYYADYVDQPVQLLGRCLAEGFAYQGERSGYRDGASRGEPSAHLPPTAFVSFIQNHDQVGNRALGERLTAIAATPALEAFAAIYLLAPQISLLFMGEEFGASTPFLYFCDFHGELGRAVSEGRRKEFSRFACFGESEPPEIPDPNNDGTFEASRLDWSTVARAPHARWLAHYRELLALRRQHIVPLLPDIASGHRWDALADAGLQVRWQLRDGGALLLDAQLSDAEARREVPASRLIYELRPSPDPSIRLPWSVRWAIA